MSPPVAPVPQEKQCVLYARVGCPFCESAEAMLEQEGVRFTRVEVDDDASRNMLANLTQEAPESLTVPKVMIGDVLIRTSEELAGLKAKSALAHLVGGAGSVSSTTRQPLPTPEGTAICVLHTGPTDKRWLSELQRALSELGGTVIYADVERLGTFDLAETLPYAAVVNRVSDAAAPPLLRFVASFLALCEAQGVPVLNGAVPYSIATSKLAQHGFFHAVGLSTPRSCVVRCVGDVDAAYKRLGGGAVIMKPRARTPFQGAPRSMPTADADGLNRREGA